MKFGVRAKLFAVSLGLIATVGVASGALFDYRVRKELGERVYGDLEAQTLSARVAVEYANKTADADFDSLADRLGSVAGAHVTIVGLDGLVRGDSEIPESELAHAASLADRPEIQAALAGGSGAAEGYSALRDAAMIYAAMRYSAAGRPAGVVRLGVPRDRIDAPVARLRTVLLFAALVGLVVAILMSGLASELMTRQLRVLVKKAKRVSKGKDERVALGSGDELDKLAGSFNRVVHDLHKTAAKLSRERARLQTVLHGMDEGVLALDEESRVRLANPAAMAMLGLAEPPTDRLLIEVTRVPALASLVKKSLAGEAASGEIDLPGKPLRRVFVRASPLAAGAEHGGAVVVMHDLTEIRRLETMRCDFVANVSHELRTPVSVISVNAETLRSGAIDDPEHRTGFIDAIQRNAERLGRLIADLLDLSRIEAGRYPLAVEPVPVADAIDEAIASVRARARDRGVTLEVQAAPHTGATADPSALEHVLLNLLDNAVKYAPENGHVWVRAETLERTVRIEVEDDGPGIAAQHRERVFERFYRVDPGRSRELGGTGLGLSIVKHLCEQMDGSVGVEPASERGSIFWVELPACELTASRRPARPAAAQPENR